MCYVDLGAAHPIISSVTKFVRDLGWRGLGVDANGDYAHAWRAAGFGHHFVCALLSDQPIVRFVVHENSQTSRITDDPGMGGVLRVENGRPSVPLNSILDQHRITNIDLLSVDLESHEFAVMQTLDWEKYAPSWIVAEYVTQGIGVDPRLCNSLLEKGYQVVHMTQANLIFRRN